ncbi:MAG: uroporphyrinogen decarboxylase family protein [Eubacteriales bacterium]|nr:uroporphyrinogen decarboxylase family protein [Eubacteriales bacterium]
MMTNKQRVIRAIRHMSTDRIPYSVYFTEPAFKSMQDFCRNSDFYDTLDSHICMYEYSHYSEVKPGYFEDHFGVVWNRSGVDKDIGIVFNKKLSEPSLKGFDMPPVDEKAVRQIIVNGLLSHPDNFNLYCIGFSLFERAWTLCGMEDLLVYMVLEPKFVHELMDLITEYNLRILDIAMEYEVDGIHFGDDWGQQQGMIMGSTHWRTFILPGIKRLYGAAKSKGKVVSQHSCGDIQEVFGDLIDAGLDVYQTFQTEIYDVERIKKEYGNHLTFWGGISTQRLLPSGTPQQVYDETCRMIELMSENGGYILAPTHAVPGDVPPENIMAMLNAANPALTSIYPQYFEFMN